MKAADNSKRYFEETRLLVLAEKTPKHSKVGDFIDFLNPGDVLVVNSSGTLPSSFRGQVARSGAPIEIRLASYQGPDLGLENWLAITFGEGDWRTPTEDREAPPEVIEGDQILIGENLVAEIKEVRHQRLVSIRFLSSNLQAELYKHGRPIQYSHLTEDLEVWDQQTAFAGPPISVEPPSAGFNFSWDLVFRLRARGVKIARVLHGAGISSSGSDLLDSKLPLAEWYQVSQETEEVINQTRASGGRVVALGTTVLRALESAMRGDQVIASSGLTSLKITPTHMIRSATSLVTGMHDLGTSHRQILNAFCGPEAIDVGYREASSLGYRGHEYGDLSLLDCYSCKVN